MGRERELAEGLALLDDVLAGRGRLLLVGGEPGIGKSRFADELAGHARGRGFRVAWGRCWEAGGAPAYWPWVQSLRAFIRDLDIQQVQAQLGPGTADVAQLLPEIGTGLGEHRQPPALDPDAARFRLFDAATRLLKSNATVSPVLVVLDDLQVADTPSLLLLRFVAADIAEDPVLILGTYRDADLRPDDALAVALSELGREPLVRRINLRGLAEADVAQFISVVSGVIPQDRLVRAVHDETEGNPLFVQEIVRLLLEEGRLDNAASAAGIRPLMPNSLREVIWRRLSPLSDRSRDILAMASVLGREFSVDALSRLAGYPLDQVIDALEEPLAVRVITDVPGSPTRLRFSHVVIRECLYEDIARTRRIRLHRRAAQVLETLYRHDMDPHLAELAHHYFEGASGDDVERAIGYARRAGAKAVLLLAYEEAVRLYQMALQGLRSSDGPNANERCEVLLALGDAQARAGDEDESKATFLQAAELSRSLGLPDHLARAALGYGGRVVWTRAGSDPSVVPLLRDGLTAMGDSDNALRARIMARLAGALRDDPASEPRESLSRNAVDLARRLGDPATLAYALEGMFAALWKPENAPERLLIASEMMAVSQQAQDWDRVVSGHMYRLNVFLELGDLDSVHRELDAVDRMAGALREPAKSWLATVLSSLLALFEGRFEEAERLTWTALRVGKRSFRTYAVAAHALHLFQLRREQGRLTEVDELISDCAREYTWYPMFRCARAVLHLELGRTKQAQMELDAMAADDFARLPRDNEWLFSLSLLSEVVHGLRDVGRASILYTKLQPYAHLNTLGPDEGCLGSLSRHLGLLASLEAHFDDAERHFEEALVQNERMGARPWVAHTQHDFALMLMARRAPGDGARATELLTNALRTCDALQMSALRAKIVAALGVQGAEEPRTVRRAEPAAAKDAAFCLEGEYWTVTYGGRVSRLHDSKGIRVLARLLAAPGRPHPSVDLERLGSPGGADVLRSLVSSDSGELLDDAARRAYRVRLAELREALDEAETCGDADQTGALREEMDYLARELGRAVGLGGRSRRAGSVAERSRLNVTRAVRSSLRRLAAADPALAAHLEATIHTGTVCAYSPDPRSAVPWHVSSGTSDDG